MILAPFKWIVALFFNWSNALFNDPGWAVVGMSVLLSLLLTPLYIWIERRKNSDKAKSAPMQAEIDKIEAVYSGRERFYYTREIQRRYKYSPWTAMIPTLGLLVQIPFLLAAYHYLLELPIFSGASFWYIKDLSKPDTIATVAGFPVNLLAILMTVINLVSGWRYAESGKTKERVQYMAVAAIFLFLLYNCAASVVLYWTLSNALSFVRSEIFFRKKGAAMKGLECRCLIPFEMVLSFAWFTTVFCACYSFCAVYVMDDTVLSLRKAIVSFDRCGAVLLLLAWIFLELFAGITRNRDLNDKHNGRACFLDHCRRLLAWGAGIAVSLALLASFTDCPLEKEPVLHYFAERAWPIVGCFAAVAFVLRFSTLRRMVDAVLSLMETRTPTIWPGLFALLYIVGVVAAWHPLLVYASEPQSFTTTPWKVAFGGVKWIVLAAVVYALTWRFCLGKILKAVLTSFFVWSAIAIFAYLFILPLDVGTLQGAELVGAERMVRNLDAYILDALALAVLGIVVTCAMRKLPCRIVASVFLILHAVVLFQGAVKCIKASAGDLSVSASATQPDFDKMADNAAVRLSKKHQNVMVFMLDMVQGHSFTNVFVDKQISQKLNGFVWYPNSVSIANMTCPSMPAIYGGMDFAPDKLNADANRSLNAKATDIMHRLRDDFKKRGFKFVHYNCNLAVFVNDLTRVSPLYDKAFLSHVTGKPDYFGVSRMLEILRCNALLQASPLVFRPFIYNGGYWRGCGLSSSGSFRPFSDDHMFYEALPKVTDLADGDEGFFNFFHVEVTHNPWGIPDADGKITKTDNVGVLKWIVARLGEYFEWMKSNGVYDNTRIVLISDHGLVNMPKGEFNPATDPMKNRQLWKKFTAGISDCRMLQEQKIQMLNNLLVIKDYNEGASLRCDGRIMSNSDLKTILECEHVTKTVATLPLEREAFVTIPATDGSGFQPNKTMDILLHFRIKNNVFDLANWERVK